MTKLLLFVGIFVFLAPLAFCLALWLEEVVWGEEDD